MRTRHQQPPPLESTTRGRLPGCRTAAGLRSAGEKGVCAVGPRAATLAGVPAAPTPHQRALARAGALTCLVVVAVAVTWPSGTDAAGAKDLLGWWLPSRQARDVVLNLLMLVPPAFLATLGWPRAPWWAWALAGCAIGAGAELLQLAVPELGRRASLANAAQNAAGAWAGALAAHLVARTWCHHDAPRA